MRIQFINVRYDETRYRYRVNKLWPPLGMAGLASIVRGQGHAVKILDMEALQMGYEALPNYLVAESPDLVGIHGTTPTSQFMARCARIARQACPAAVIVAGGCHASLLPEAVLQAMPEVDYLLRGEAEHTFPELVRCLEEGASDEIAEIPGIGLRRAGRVFISTERPLVEDLDSLPLPAYDLLPLGAYFSGSHDAEKTERAMTIMSTRGCPHSCIFCSEPVLYGHRFRARSAKSLVNEMELLHRDYGITHISFYDASFMADARRVEALCREILDRHLTVTWRARARADHITEALVWRMKEAGCTELAIGVETGSQRLLDIMNKHTTLEAIERGFQIMKDAGLWISAFFIFGIPGETREESYRTIEFAKKLDPDWALFAHATPLPGTRMYDMVREDRLSHDWSDYRFATNSPVMLYGGMSREEIQEIMNYAYRAFYVRKEWLLNRLKKAHTPAQIRQIVDSFFDYLSRESAIPAPSVSTP